MTQNAYTQNTLVVSGKLKDDLSELAAH